MKGVFGGLVLLLVCAACATGPINPPESPAEGARHRAALATVTVVNGTADSLIIAFRSATPPVQEIIIGRVGAQGHRQLAPVPAGEPIVLIARTTDGREFALGARSFPIDADWTWEIPRDATFQNPAK